VCLVLDKMTRNGLLVFVEDIDKNDRIYKLNS
ncbi:DUF3895 domain-containing protein, partial [Winogradskyella ouciana]